MHVLVNRQAAWILYTIRPTGVEDNEREKRCCGNGRSSVTTDLSVIEVNNNIAGVVVLVVPRFARWTYEGEGYIYILKDLSRVRGVSILAHSKTCVVGLPYKVLLSALFIPTFRTFEIPLIVSEKHLFV